MPSAEQPGIGLAAVLRGVVVELQRASAADMVSLFLYDEYSGRYFAPFALGQPETSLLESLADMREQLERYKADLEQRKVPDELGVQQYGSTVWLTVTRRLLVARDAAAEVASTFVRRHGVESTVGLPLLADRRLIGLVYLNYTKRAQVPDDEALSKLQRQASEAAHQVEAALADAERAALSGVAKLTSLLTSPVRDDAALRRVLSIALAEVLLATDIDAAAVYAVSARGDRLELLTAHAPAAVPRSVELAGDPEESMRAALKPTGLELIAPFRLGGAGDPLGYLAVLDRDPLAAARQPPSTEVLLQATAGLIGGALSGRRLIASLEHGGKLLGALAGMTNAMIRPGSSQQQVLEAAVQHLTDAAVPEFDFHFATVFLLGVQANDALAVRAAAGAARVESIDASKSSRVPRWALDGERLLSSQDVLVHVAKEKQTVVVGSAHAGDETVAGGLPEPVTWTNVPAIRSDGSTAATVPAALVGEAAGEIQVPPFTLAGDIFESSGHGDLIRVFVPFGLAAAGHASGVLEVGYHRSFDRRPDWGQIQALQAAAAQVAIAVETARLYEETRQRSRELELSADVSRAIASSIDLDQTLRLVAVNLARLVNASLCQIALYEEDGVAWYGAAASDQEDEWRRQRGERPQPSFLFDVLDRGSALVLDDVDGDASVSLAYAQAFGIRSLMALPLIADGQPIGAAVLAERGRQRTFTAEERRLAQGLAVQAAVAIKNARLHALAEEERHIQKDFVLIGLGQWGQKAYHHLQTLKQFFNFRVHVVEQDVAGARERLAEREKEVVANGDAFYWDSPASSAHEQLSRQLEPSPYVITYVATPAATHLPTVATYHDLSDVMLIEKPLGAPPEAYREFLDSAPSGVEIVAADHYYFKLEVRLLQLLLTEERTLRDFLESVEEIRVEILEEQPLTGAAADIGVVADLIPHAFAILSLFTSIDRVELDRETPLLVGRHASMQGSRESYARLSAGFPYRGRRVRLVVDVGKGVENAKWIRLSGEKRERGRSPFYKFDFGKGEAIDGTQSTVRAATRRIREPGVPDNAHLSMLRHVLEKRRPAVGILSIREALRANQRIRDLEDMAGTLLANAECEEYPLGSRPAFARPSPSGHDGQAVEPAPYASGAVKTKT
jgi:GAF domain-containing protein